MAMDSTELPGTTTMTFCLGPRSKVKSFSRMLTVLQATTPPFLGLSETRIFKLCLIRGYYTVFLLQPFDQGEQFLNSLDDALLFGEWRNRYKESGHRFCADPWHFNTIGDAVDKVVNIRGTQIIHDVF